MEYRTIEGVELVTVGMEWHAASGEETFTFENLSDAVEAANEDPHIIDPRVKLGHTSEVNGALNHIDPFEALGDAAPAFGRVVNLRLANDGAVLLGDFVEVPAWLADAMPSAYPNRSIEARRMVETEGGKHYSMVLTAVALLGPVLPACTELEDIERVLIEGPSGVAAASNPHPEEGRMTEITASVATGTIRERFNFDWAMDSDNGVEQDTYWWWARDVRVDPNEIIADDTEGGLWSVPFETDGKDEVTFGEPVRVREEFVPVTASATSVVAKLRDRKDQRVLASNLERPEKPAPKAAASQPEEEDTMDAKAIRESLGLAESATDEQVLAKAAELKEAGEEEQPEGEETPEGTEEATGGEPATPEAVAASHGQVVDKQAFAQLQEDAKAGRDARASQLSAERAQIVTDAVKAGKFPPSAEAAYREQLDKGGEIEASTRKFIDGLPDNTVPVEETGITAAKTDEAEMGQIMAAFGKNQKAAA
jgi:hypothetical protein